MPDLRELGLTEEAAPQVDWDAPEAGKTPPPVFPGLYKLLFSLPEDKSTWFDAVERETIKGKPESKRKFLELTYTPIIVADGQGRPLANEDGTPIQMGPQRVNTYMSPKMHIHQFAELLRACGVRIEGSFLAEIEVTVAQMNNKATFDAELIWRCYFKSTDTTYSTAPRKKQGELPWPRTSDGNFELMVKNPATGESAYGYLEVARARLPQVAGEGGQ